MYIHDYGAPAGFRIAVANPEKIETPIIQNGNAHEAGVDPAALLDDNRVLEGSADRAAVYDGVEYDFATAEAKAAFEADLAADIPSSAASAHWASRSTGSSTATRASQICATASSMSS